jgi:branched-chain amino acid transport system substrate-binding protein
MKHLGENFKAVLLSLGFALSAPALAQDITIGVLVSTTGPGSAVGVPTRNALALWPTEIAGRKLNVIVQDDRSDPAVATQIARRMAVDDKVDVLIGSSLTPANVSVSAVASETQTPHLTLAPIVTTVEKSPWSFNLPSLSSNMASAVFEHMTKNKIQSVGYIGFSDTWGDQWLDELKAYSAKSGVRITGEERYGRADTSVAGQALRLIASNPDAVLVGGTSSAAGLVQNQLRELNYKGPIYHTHGAVTKDFIRIAAKAGEGAISPSGLSAVAEDLEDSLPNKGPAMTFVKGYESKHGVGTRTPFAAQLYDAAIVLQHAVPVALAKAKPGTPEFKVALKQAIEGLKNVAGSQALFNYSPSDHNGTDARSRVLVVVKDGSWRYLR